MTKNLNMSDSTVAIMSILSECTIDHKRLKLENEVLKIKLIKAEQKLKKKR